MRSGAIARASSTSSLIVLSSMQVSDVRLRRTHRCAQHVPSTEADSDFGFPGWALQNLQRSTMFTNTHTCAVLSLSILWGEQSTKVPSPHIDTPTGKFFPC